MILKALLPFVGTLALAGVAALLIENVSVGKSHEPGFVRSVTSLNSLDSSTLPATEVYERQPARSEFYYQIIVERPLFAPGRRPIVAQSVTTETPVLLDLPKEESAPPMLPIGIRLSGVLGGTEDRSALLVHDQDDGTWYRAGDNIDQWTIGKVGSDWVELFADDRIIRLELFR